MYHLARTLGIPAEDVALDEQLLEAAESDELPGEVLRTWESPHYFAVLGRSSPGAEVQAAACSAEGVPVVRRASGGGAVVGGPGCLSYAVVLDRRRRPSLATIAGAHRLVLDVVAAALRSLAAAVERAGTSDLVLPDSGGGRPRKISGNSLRVKRNHILYHGTILYDFDLDRIARWLGPPTREPDYRAGRAHRDFVANVPATRIEIETALVEAWDAHMPLNWPHDKAQAG